MALVRNRDIPFLLFKGACHVLRTGIYIASSPPLGHHHSYIYLHKHTTFHFHSCPGRDTNFALNLHSALQNLFQVVAGDKLRNAYTTRILPSNFDTWLA
jgi:hypothetical protein